jgi:hypothetical protein
MMSLTRIVSILGFTIVIAYIIIQLCTFYDVSPSSYGTYLVFYLFLILSTIMLQSE